MEVNGLDCAANSGQKGAHLVSVSHPNRSVYVHIPLLMYGD